MKPKRITYEARWWFAQMRRVAGAAAREGDECEPGTPNPELETAATAAADGQQQLPPSDRDEDTDHTDRTD